MPIVSTSYGNVVFLPVQARRPMRETLAWSTDVFTSRNGTETRAAVRETPRQSFNMIFPAKSNKIQEALNVAYGSRDRSWIVPLWAEAQSIGAVASGVATVNADTTNSTYQTNGFALLWANGSYEVQEIQSFDASTITFKSVTAAAYSGAYIMPMRVGRLASNPNKVSNGLDTVYNLSFDITENYDLSPEAATTYLMYDFDSAPIEAADGANEDLAHEVETYDNESGKSVLYVPWTNPKPVKSYDIIKETPAEIIAFKRWLHRRAGRLNPFWQPSFEKDFRVTSTGAVTNVLRVYADSHNTLSPERTHIAVKHAGGWTPATITGVVTVGADQLDLTLDVNLGLDAEDITYVSYMGLKRLNSDRVEMEYGGGVMTSKLSVIEVSP